MPWLNVTFAVEENQLDSISEHLELAGAQSVTIEDAGDNPLFDLLDGEHPVWDCSLVTGLFNVQLGVDEVIAKLTRAFAPDALPECRVESLPEQDWERSWMDRFQPMQYGRNLWICPTWYKPPDPEAINIMLDPGLAFGSGSHETTRLCMQWLSTQRLEGKVVIDYGCGSGILAIAALKSGAASALGVDIDQQALQASRQNAQRNQVSERLQLALPANMPDQSAGDIVFANILAGTLVELKTQLLTLRKAQGVLVLSGILQSQQAMIYKEFEPGNTIQSFNDGDWMMMSVTAQT
jgi:ribosomal protein L11 methyltransferase